MVIKKIIVVLCHFIVVFLPITCSNKSDFCSRIKSNTKDVNKTQPLDTSLLENSQDKKKFVSIGEATMRLLWYLSSNNFIQKQYGQKTKQFVQNNSKELITILQMALNEEKNVKNNFLEDLFITQDEKFFKRITTGLFVYLRKLYSETHIVGKKQNNEFTKSLEKMYTGFKNSISKLIDVKEEISDNSILFTFYIAIILNKEYITNEETLSVINNIQYHDTKNDFYKILKEKKKINFIFNTYIRHLGNNNPRAPQTDKTLLIENVINTYRKEFPEDIDKLFIKKEPRKKENVKESFSENEFDEQGSEPNNQDELSEAGLNTSSIEQWQQRVQQRSVSSEEVTDSPTQIEMKKNFQNDQGDGSSLIGSQNSFPQSNVEESKENSSPPLTKFMYIQIPKSENNFIKEQNFETLPEVLKQSQFLIEESSALKKSSVEEQSEQHPAPVSTSEIVTYEKFVDSNVPSDDIIHSNHMREQDIPQNDMKEVSAILDQNSLSDKNNSVYKSTSEIATEGSQNSFPQSHVEELKKNSAPPSTQLIHSSIPKSENNFMTEQDFETLPKVRKQSQFLIEESSALEKNSVEKQSKQHSAPVSTSEIVINEQFADSSVSKNDITHSNHMEEQDIPQNDMIEAPVILGKNPLKKSSIEEQSEQHPALHLTSKIVTDKEFDNNELPQNNNIGGEQDIQENNNAETSAILGENPLSEKKNIAQDNINGSWQIVNSVDQQNNFPSAELYNSLRQSFINNKDTSFIDSQTQSFINQLKQSRIKSKTSPNNQKNNNNKHNKKKYWTIFSISGISLATLGYLLAKNKNFRSSLVTYFNKFRDKGKEKFYYPISDTIKTFYKKII